MLIFMKSVKKIYFVVGYLLCIKRWSFSKIFLIFLLAGEKKFFASLLLVQKVLVEQWVLIWWKKSKVENSAYCIKSISFPKPTTLQRNLAPLELSITPSTSQGAILAARLAKYPPWELKALNFDVNLHEISEKDIFCSGIFALY